MTNAKDNIEKLPRQCYGVLPSTQKLILIRAGESGYYNVGQGYPESVCKTEGITMSQLVDNWNAEDNITTYQRKAMEQGSMFGWEVSSADPDFWEGKAQMVQN